MMKVTIEMPEEYMGDIMGDVTLVVDVLMVWNLVVMHKLLTLMYHFQKCSVTQLHYVLTLKVAVLTLCTSITMQKFQNQFDDIIKNKGE